MSGNNNKIQILIDNKSKLPIEAIRMVAKWDFIQKSPYSLSLYDKVKDWNDALPDTIRVADHWNFYSKDRMHCQTSVDVPNNTHWCIAKFDSTTRKFVPMVILPVREHTLEERIEIEMIILELQFEKAINKLGIISKDMALKIELGFLNRKFNILEKFYK